MKFKFKGNKKKRQQLSTKRNYYISIGTWLREIKLCNGLQLFIYAFFEVIISRSVRWCYGMEQIQCSDGFRINFSFELSYPRILQRLTPQIKL